jgi:Asp/Glu/hydantoin racemase
MDERFLRIPGDVGNASTFSFPVIYKIIKGYSGPDIVSKKVNLSLKSSLCKAAKELEEKGVKAIVGGCGFFGRFQKELTESVNIPVFSSSLLFVPMISRTLPLKKKRVGILFAQASQVSDELLKAVGIDESIPIAHAGFDWVEDSEMDWNESDPEKMQQNLNEVLVKLARMLIIRAPDIGALVFECTNMPPAAHAIQEKTGLPIFDVTTLVKLVHSTVIRKRFDGYM